jgi:pimeloyl-ACP methyl ester carboxylesterase
MNDYTKTLPHHIEKYIGENDLFLQLYEGENPSQAEEKRPPLLFVHGAYGGSWMWSKYIPHFVCEGWKCYVMNMRSHYKSRLMDLTKVSFQDYLADIKEVISECGEVPILLGHSMGGILGQKLAETVPLAGLVLIDSSICREIYKMAPYRDKTESPTGIIIPAPAREEIDSVDESADDIIFQRKYLTMESLRAIREFAFYNGTEKGISVDNKLITCPCLVISAVNSDEGDHRGRATAQYYSGEYTGFWNTTHTGLLVGQRYMEVVDRILEWVKKSTFTS